MLLGDGVGVHGNGGCDDGVGDDGGVVGDGGCDDGGCDA